MSSRFSILWSKTKAFLCLSTELGLILLAGGSLLRTHLKGSVTISPLHPYPILELHNRNWNPFLVPWPCHAFSCLRALIFSSGLLCLEPSPSFIPFYPEHPIPIQVQHIWLYRLCTEELQENSNHIWVYVTTIPWSFTVSTQSYMTALVHQRYPDNSCFFLKSLLRGPFLQEALLDFLSWSKSVPVFCPPLVPHAIDHSPFHKILQPSVFLC